jgi:hypothetical protein
MVKEGAVRIHLYSWPRTCFSWAMLIQTQTAAILFLSDPVTRPILVVLVITTLFLVIF